MAQVGKLPVGETFMLPWNGVIGKVLGHTPCGTKVQLRHRTQVIGEDAITRVERVTLADSTECKVVEL